MSFMTTPDPHPGRCPNYRSKVHPDGYLEAARCLEYDATEHVCRFPAFVHQASPGGIAYSQQTVAPKPWVRPDDA